MMWRLDCPKPRREMWRLDYTKPDREWAFNGLPMPALIWLAQVLSGRTADTRPAHPRTPSTAFDDPASTRLGQFFGPAADKHPGLSGFSLLSQAREAFITRLALADLAERSLDMQYYMWDGDTTGRIIVEHVMKAADRGVRVRLLVDDPYLQGQRFRQSQPRCSPQCRDSSVQPAYQPALVHS